MPFKFTTSKIVVSSGLWWWTGEPGVLQSTGLQRVRHDRATELNWFSGGLAKIYLWSMIKRKYIPSLAREIIWSILSSDQFSSVTPSCPTLGNPINHSTPGLPVHHQFPEFTQTHVHWVGDAIQMSHPLSYPSSSTFNLSQHQGLFKWVRTLHQVANVLEFQFQHQSFQ